MPEVTSLTRNRLRVALDNAYPGVIQNQVTGTPLVFYVAKATQIEFVILYDTVLQSVAPFASITAELKTVTNGVPDVDSAPVVSTTLTAADLDSGADLASWLAKTNQQGIIAFSNSQMAAFDMTGAVRNQKDFYLVITALTTDGTARRITLGYGIVAVIDDGGQTSAVTPVAGDPLYLTADETMALLNQSVKTVTAAGGSLTFMNSTGYGIKLTCTEGSQPELQETQIQPPLP